VALGSDAFVDAVPETTGHEAEVGERERAEIASWRGADGPVLGRDVDAGVTPLVTLRLDDGYAAAKLLHVDRRGVHLRLYAERWEDPPDEVDAWRLGLGTTATGSRGVGHVPMTRRAFGAAHPAFARLAMIGPAERAGYREWLEAGGGYFG
jgi:hypothetical protein